MLRCEECRATADAFQLGWVSFYARFAEDEDPQPVLLTYCAKCASRELGSLLHPLSGVSAGTARAELPDQQSPPPG
jgi:hypothetical protein